MNNNELAALMTLIMSWEPNNLELAMSIMRGSPELHQAVQDRFAAILALIGDPPILAVLTDLPFCIERGICHPRIPYQEDMIPILRSMPVKDLYLIEKDLSEVPWWVMHLEQLETLMLRNNHISVLPDSITQLQNLEKIDMERNQLRELPEQIGALQKLEQLCLDFNPIERLPESIGQLKKLYSLCLEESKLCKLPASMKDLEGIYWLSIEKSPLGNHFGLIYGEYLSVDDPRYLSYLTTEIPEDAS